MEKAQQVTFLRSIQVACVVGIGFVGLIGFLMFAGGESFSSISGAVTENFVRTWHAALRFDVEELLRQWIGGALGLLVCAALGIYVVRLLSQDARD